MISRFYTHVFLIIALIVPASAADIRIPDPTLLNRLIALGYDLNDDKKIQTEEALKVTELKLDGLGIINAQGLNQFTNLVTLHLRRNQLTSIDLSGMTGLREILLANNRITLITVKNLPPARRTATRWESTEHGARPDLAHWAQRSLRIGLRTDWPQRSRSDQAGQPDGAR